MKKKTEEVKDLTCPNCHSASLKRKLYETSIYVCTSCGREYFYNIGNLYDIIFKQSSVVSNDKHTFASGAQRAQSLDQLRYDLIPPVVLRALAEIFTEGVPKYGEHNWEKGLPYSDTFNHLFSHLLAWRRGDTSEPHLKKVLWGIAVLVYYEAKFGVDNELNDMKDVVW